MVRTTATTASTHSKHIIHKFIQILMKVVVKGAGEGRGAYLDSKMTGWAGSAPKTTLLGPASFSLAKQLNRGGGGGGGEEFQTASLDLPLYIIYTTSKEYFFATVGSNFCKCKFRNRATDRKS